MRQILSTALVALVVAALTAVSVSAMAQSEPATNSTYSPAAGLNADTVDHRHAVGFTNNKGARRNKLVATNRYGLLPSNIVKPLWGLIKGMPAGFADGVDDGIVHMTTTQVASDPQSIPALGDGSVSVTCPAGSHVISGGFAASSYLVFAVDSIQSGNGWLALAHNSSGAEQTMRATAVCLTTDPIGVLRTRDPLKARDLLPLGK
jgi:hypothetical protein